MEGNDIYTEISESSLEGNNTQADGDVQRKIAARQNIEAGSWKVVKKEGGNVHSDVWKHFGIVVGKENQHYKGFVQCFKCKLIKIYASGSSTSPLKKHVCCVKDTSSSASSSGTKSVTAEMKKSFRDACVQMCVGDIRSFATFHGSHFENVIQTVVDLVAENGRIDAAQLISHPTTISRAVSSLADQKRHEIMPEIRRVMQRGMCAATTDLWTEDFSRRHYVTVTLHYITENWNLTSRVLATQTFMEESESGENISNALKLMFAQYDVDENDVKKLKFTTDGGANVLATKILGVIRLYCADHKLNVVLRTTFTLKLIDLDLFGECGRSVVNAVGLAIDCIKTLKIDINLAKKLVIVPADSTSRIFRTKLPSLQLFLDHFDKVSPCFTILTVFILRRVFLTIFFSVYIFLDRSGSSREWSQCHSGPTKPS